MSNLKSRLPWQDRWNQPDTDELLKPLKAQHRRILEKMMAQLDELGATERQLVYYDPEWNWTIQYKLPAQGKDGKDQPRTLCYLIPNHEQPLICVPLSDDDINQLPIKKLAKLVREGIRIAKNAVATHWAIWSPNNQVELAHVLDLVTQTHELAVTEAQAAPASKSRKRR